MVTNLFLNVILLPIKGIFDVLPQIGSGLGLNALATTITTSSYWPNLGWGNDYFPLDLAVNLFISLIAIVVTMLGIRVVLWVYHQFWGGN